MISANTGNPPPTHPPVLLYERCRQDFFNTCSNWVFDAIKPLLSYHTHYCQSFSHSACYVSMATIYDTYNGKQRKIKDWDLYAWITLIHHGNNYRYLLSWQFFTFLFFHLLLFWISCLNFLPLPCWFSHRLVPPSLSVYRTSPGRWRSTATLSSCPASCTMQTRSANGSSGRRPNSARSISRR